ncbi:MAG: hypothetical protein WCX77_03245 [Candidatus Paceibacterota bacterium]|jgi:hypothetical protein
MNFLKENWFKIIVATTLILISISIFYYLILLNRQKASGEKEISYGEKDVGKLQSSFSDESSDLSLPKSESVSSSPALIAPTYIDGLAAIRISGGIWENWDADSEKDGPFIEIVYLDNRGEIIVSDEAVNLPISADVKIFSTDMSNHSFKKGRLVYSAHYSKDQIIFGNILYPRIRILKEQININPEVDYPYGYASVTIHTPKQGDYSDESNLGFIVLYEK